VDGRPAINLRFPKLYNEEHPDYIEFFYYFKIGSKSTELHKTEKKNVFYIQGTSKPL